MKKIYLSVLSVAMVSGLNAQIRQDVPALRSSDPSEAKPLAVGNEIKALPLWENTFDDANDWVLDHDASACSLDWEIGMGLACQGSYPIDNNNAFASTTAADGYAILDSDFYGGSAGGSEVENSWMTTAAPITLGGFTNVVVQWESMYRSFNSEMPYIVIGYGDGAGNVVWPVLDPLTDVSAMPNVYQAMPNVVQQALTGNPEIFQLNISAAVAAAPDPTDLYLRFHWTGTWGYAWFVDDVQIIEQPADDIQLLSAWISGSGNEGIEYGRTPSDQIDADYLVGGQVFNFGINDQTAIAVDAVFTGPSGFTSNSTYALLEADSTVFLEQTEAAVSAVGAYAGTYVATSQGEMAGANFGNNTYMRNFEITDDLYSTDLIGGHPAGYEDLTSTGTTSFTDAEDGLVCANMYHIKQTEEVHSLIVMLATGTVEGAEVYGSIKDTVSFFADDMTSLYNTTALVVSAADIANGYIRLDFPGGATLAPGAYFAAIEMYSQGNTFDIRILDDRTVAQPWYASMIYIPGDAAYSNGDAFAIRMEANHVGTDELSLDGVSVYPNPSEGIVNVTNANGASNTITVTDMAGRVIMTTVATATTTLDLSANGTGMYVVTVSNDNGSIVERVVIK
ncbi:MAG: T9SS type A sorting domain-containing protein [Crocinitomicaceae bacterium]|nr:T9SS type A sorting domain-containing protein [Crocinitomicaceae bacterium]